jgi:hypothetical protein
MDEKNDNDLATANGEITYGNDSSTGKKDAVQAPIDKSKYCLNCVQERALPPETAHTWVNEREDGSSLMIKCVGCGWTTVYPDGTCSGMCRTRAHNKTPWWKLLWWRFRRQVIDAIYFVKCHTLPSYMYHWLDLRNPQYEYGWKDADSKILFACFKVLSDFVEGEQGLNTLVIQGPAIRNHHNEWCGKPGNEREDGQNCECLKTAEDADKIAEEIRNLYHYWKTGRAAAQEALNTDEWTPDMQAEFEAEEQRMLMKLIELRRYLWT